MRDTELRKGENTNKVKENLCTQQEVNLEVKVEDGKEI